MGLVQAGEPRASVIGRGGWQFGPPAWGCPFGRGQVGATATGLPICEANREERIERWHARRRGDGRRQPQGAPSGLR